MKIINSFIYKNKFILSLLIASSLYAGSYDNGINAYKKGSYKKAMDSFIIASNNDDNRAMLVIGIMYANGDGITKDPAKSLEWFTKAANANNSHAFSKLGNIYASKEDYKNAVKWFKKAALKGDNKAAYNLGYFYTGGLGVAMDLKEAFKWYTHSAKDGNINAQINLGFAYIGGHGTKKDLKQAAFWIKKAKDTGSSKAELLWDQFKLYEYGEKK
ncbi:MAG: tetratricopeptide repeat protein [Campylobacterota bacterium]|nr:tetratricopeptide repeat protein [Campylobacterota bacterium]